MDKLDQLQEKLNSIKEELEKAAKKPKQPKPATTTIGSEDHPSTLSETDVKKLIKEEAVYNGRAEDKEHDPKELLKFSENGQWNLKAK